MDLQTAFWILITLICLELLALYVIGNSIRTTLQSDYFKQKMANLNKREKKDNSSGGMGVLLLLIMMTIPAIGGAADSVSETVSEPWIHVTEGMLYVLLSVAVILLFIIIYLKNLFTSLLNIDKTEEELAVEDEAQTSKFLHILTDAVPIDQEETIATDHEYDGIRELDNNLPPWWLWGFYASIAFAFIYLVRFHVVKTGDLQEEAYEKTMKEEDAKVASYLVAQKINVNENTVVIMEDATDIATGGGHFEKHCVVCHLPNGGGSTGPNLTDEYWIHGGDIKDIFSTIKYGVESKGMRSWNTVLSGIQMQQVASYIMQLDEVTAADGGKEPEGEKHITEE